LRFGTGVQNEIDNVNGDLKTVRRIEYGES